MKVFRVQFVKKTMNNNQFVDKNDVHFNYKKIIPMKIIKW